MNIAVIRIENCLNCPNCYLNHIPTEDSWEHETGAYCKLVEDKETGRVFGQNGKHRIIGSDDWHLDKYTSVPDWCPLLEKK